jgi:predicted metal-binding membrane protein
MAASVESTKGRRVPPLPGLIQLGLVGALIALAGLAWVVTNNRMSGMDAGPGTDPRTLGFFLGVWVVMMAAMMFPSIVPMVLMHERVQMGRRERSQPVPAGATTLFVAGYLIVWAGAGLIAYGLYKLGAVVFGEVFSWRKGGPYLAGAIIAGAAAYQLTPLKDVCLRYCRSPLIFLMDYWRPGRLGALRMGLLHGGWCTGCCWMLMAALFAVGVMSLGWMAFFAVLIAIEKLLPWKALANRGIAVLLVVLGLAVAFSAKNVPGLTLPDSPAAQRAMQSMMGMSTGSMHTGSMHRGASENMHHNAMGGSRAGMSTNQTP